MQDSSNIVKLYFDKMLAVIKLLLTDYNNTIKLPKTKYCTHINFRRHRENTKYMIIITIQDSNYQN